MRTGNSSWVAFIRLRFICRLAFCCWFRYSRSPASFVRHFARPLASCSALRSRAAVLALAARDTARLWRRRCRHSCDAAHGWRNCSDHWRALVHTYAAFVVTAERNFSLSRAAHMHDAALFWTADQGGSITHGSNYLTAYMPSTLKRLTLTSTKTPPTSFYAMHINPIFDSNCASLPRRGEKQWRFASGFIRPFDEGRERWSGDRCGRSREEPFAAPRDASSRS